MGVADRQYLTNQIKALKRERDELSKQVEHLKTELYEWEESDAATVALGPTMAELEARVAELAEVLEHLVGVIDMADPPDYGYIYDHDGAECCGCGNKAATMGAVKHDEDCLQDAREAASAVLANLSPSVATENRAGESK